MIPFVLANPSSQENARAFWSWAITTRQAGMASKALCWLLAQGQRDLTVADPEIFTTTLRTLFAARCVLTAAEGEGTTGWVFSDRSALLVFERGGKTVASCHPMTVLGTASDRELMVGMLEAARLHPDHQPTIASHAHDLERGAMAVFWAPLGAHQGTHEPQAQAVVDALVHTLATGVVIPALAAVLTTHPVRVQVSLQSGQPVCNGHLSPPRLAIGLTRGEVGWEKKLAINPTWWGEEVGRSLYAGRIQGVPSLHLLGQEPGQGHLQYGGGQANGLTLALASLPFSTDLSSAHHRIHAKVVCQGLGVPVLA